MSLTHDQARALLSESALRVTPPRLAVLGVLAAAQRPLSHTEVLRRLGDVRWDPATIYRNLVRLSGAGIAHVVSRADGIDRYVLAKNHSDDHKHAHFICDSCGQIACLPAELTASMSVTGPWAASVQQAMIQLRGECPECL